MLIEYDATRKARGAAVIISNSKLLLIHRQHPNRGDYWVLPGGHVELGENPKAATIRELKEEANIDINIDRLIYITDFINEKVSWHFLCQTYAGELAAVSDNHTDTDQHIFKWVSPIEITELNIRPRRLREWLAADMQNGFKDDFRYIREYRSDEYEPDS